MSSTILLNFPYSLVQVLDMLRDLFHVLNGSTISDDFVSNFRRPHIESNKVLHQIFVYDCEFTSEYTTGVHVRSEWLNGLVVSKNLSCGCSWHWSHQQRVSDTIFLDLIFKALPVPTVRGSDIPHIELENALGHW